jgi:hypothetical protein
LQDEQQSLAGILQHGPASTGFSICGLPHSDFAQKSFARGERYVWRIAMRTRMLRKLGEQTSPDLDRRQVLLCLGYAENFLSIALLGRLSFSGVMQQLGSLQRLMTALESGAGRLSLSISQTCSNTIAALQGANRAASFHLLAGSCDVSSTWMKVFFKKKKKKKNN